MPLNTIRYGPGGPQHYQACAVPNCQLKNWTVWSCWSNCTESGSQTSSWKSRKDFRSQMKSEGHVLGRTLSSSAMVFLFGMQLTGWAPPTLLRMTWGTQSIPEVLMSRETIPSQQHPGIQKVISGVLSKLTPTNLQNYKLQLQIGGSFVWYPTTLTVSVPRMI